MSRLIMLVCAALLVASCGGDELPTTQVVVVVRSDLVPGEELTRIEVDVQSEAGRSVHGKPVTFDLHKVGDAAKGDDTLPLSFGIVRPTGGAARFRVVIAGYGPGLTDEVEKLVESKANGEFQEGKTLELVVWLARACVRRGCEDADDPSEVVCYGRAERGVAAGECGPILAPPLRAIVPGDESLEGDGDTAGDGDSSGDGDSTGDGDMSAPGDGDSAGDGDTSAPGDGDLGGDGDGPDPGDGDTQGPGDGDAPGDGDGTGDGDGSCIPDCAGRECGSDGCPDGSCGTCAEGLSCSDAGQCMNPSSCTSTHLRLELSPEIEPLFLPDFTCGHDIQFAPAFWLADVNGWGYLDAPLYWDVAYGTSVQVAVNCCLITTELCASVFDTCTDGIDVLPCQCAPESRVVAASSCDGEQLVYVCGDNPTPP